MIRVLSVSNFLFFLVLPLLTLGVPRPSYGHDVESHCPQFSGNFTVSAYQLYPENGDFDFNNCVLYIGILWNASVGIYDPYANEIEVIEFEGITHNPDFHVGGVQFNQRTDLLSIVVDAGAAFNTGGQDISGTNYLMLWDPTTRELIYKLNLTTVSQGQYGAFQDAEHDPENNVYVVGTYPSSVMKVDGNGQNIDPWYLDDNLNHTIAGFNGLASHGWTLITNDEATGSLYRFDMRSERGTPAEIKVSPPHKLVGTDAIQLPRKYAGTVLLVAEISRGISVYRDRTGKWHEAEYLGLVEWSDPVIVVTAPLQVGDGLYFNLVPFGGGGAGNQSEFLYLDITDRVEALLGN